MRILVHFHIYYKEQLPAFLKKLLLLNKKYTFHLAVTVMDGHPALEEITQQVTHAFPNADLFCVPNIGYDVYPFIYALKKFDLREYDYVAKLHTKSNSRSGKTYLNECELSDRTWCNHLIYALIGSPENFGRALDILALHDEVGLVGAESCIIEESTFLKETNCELKRMGLQMISRLQFVAGTMFIVKAKYMLPLSLYDESFFGRSDSSVKDGTFSHVCERLFGGVVLSQGGQLSGLPCVRFPLLRKAQLHIIRCLFGARRILSRLVVWINQNEYARAIKESDLFDEVWYQNRYLSSQKRTVDPALHYLLYGGFRGYDPSENFSSMDYYRFNPDIQKKGLNPLVHYLLRGKSEGRKYRF